VKPKLGCATTVDERTPSYVGYINFGLEDEYSPANQTVHGSEIGYLRAFYLNGIPVYDKSTGFGNPSAINVLNTNVANASDYDDFEDAFQTPTTEFV